MTISLFLCTVENVLPFSSVHLFRRSTKLSMMSLRTERVQISNCVYSGKLRAITELKEAIREQMRAIPRSVCRDVIDNFVPRLKKCTELNGGHLATML